MKSVLPFKVNYCPIKELALIPFEKCTDRVYRGFELQYLDSVRTGTGYRVIGYRNDNYVDVYDESVLLFQKDEKFDVAENGLNKHVQVPTMNATFKKINGCESIVFRFKDLENREINFEITERTNRKSTLMNLLAPIGLGSQNPNFLPLFFMYDFDFIRKSKTSVNCFIDQKKMKLDNFMFPMNSQFRYYSRYSNNCELLEFANTDYEKLQEVEVQNGSYREDNVEYIFEKSNALKAIVVHIEDGNININFTPSFNIQESMNGSFEIVPKEKMGYLNGVYSITKECDTTQIKMSVPSGWIPVPNSFITRRILNKKSVFCNWSKNYEFMAEIDLNTKAVKSYWKNKNL